MRHLIFAAVCVLVPFCGAEPDFNRDIRPILSENCLHCHGPDAEERKAKLRLDTREGALDVLTSGEFLARILSHDPDEKMPPPDANRTLTRQQIKHLKQWVEADAPYATHWAFVPPVRKPGQSIDDFVDARRPAPASEPAGRNTLIRRLSLDLIGLPPTPEEVDVFLRDTQPGATERLVDRLLTSPRFGERWARPWLDLARYADSNGFQADQLRDSWAFRDWVIDALNANMPFDRFSIEQLAGDLLPGSTVRQKIATGFHRTVTCNVEAGVHPEENRMNQVFDRVNTTATVWLGLTLECSQCHDHKYDPLPQADYYRMLAYFNNTPVEVRNPSGKGVSFDFYGPKMELPLDGTKAARRSALEAERSTLIAKRDSIRDGAAEFEDWLERQRTAGPASWETLHLTRFETNAKDTHDVLPDGSVLFGGPVPAKAEHTLTFTGRVDGIRGFRIDALTHKSLPGSGPGRGDKVRNNFVLHELQIIADGKPVSLHAAAADFSQAGWDVGGAIDGNPKTGWAIAPQFSKPHWASFKTLEPLQNVRELKLKLVQNFGTGRVLGRIKLSATASETPSQLGGKFQAILRKPRKEWTRTEQQFVRSSYGKQDPKRAKLDAQIEKLDKQIASIKPDSTLVMVEQATPRNTFVLNRGNYLDPKERVSPGTPDVLHPLDDSLPANRLGLAQWIMSENNPLVARVTVNRWWSELFGRGLVETLEDFGTQAAPPTHPELLDWLAVEFMDHGWDRKHLLKTMVLSKAYQQSSVIRPEALRLDPDNRWLTRGPRYRLDAETIRDNALTVCGLLDTTMYGRPIMPYQPDKVWRQVGRNEPKWNEQKDAHRWRRGIYIVYRRAAPYPSMVNFDAPDRGACTVKRSRTNTPLQALTLLNDPAYVEMAVALADRVLRERPDANPDERINHLFRCVLSRDANDRERSHLRGVLAREHAAFQADKKATQALLNGTRGVLNPGSDPAELAAWFHLANTLLNLDETMTKE